MMEQLTTEQKDDLMLHIMRHISHILCVNLGIPDRSDDEIMTLCREDSDIEAIESETEVLE